MDDFMKVLFSAQMKELEKNSQRLGVGYWELMQNAGRAAADWIFKNLSPGRCLVLCGNGNNGGDGCVAAAALYERGVKVSVAMLAGEQMKTREAAEAFELARSRGVAVVLQAEAERCLAQSDVVIDALFGTGFHGELPPQYARLVPHITGRVVSLDIPSGLSADAPDEGVCFEADYTLCFETAKIAGVMLPAARHFGEIAVLPVGIPQAAWSTVEKPGRALSPREAAGLLPVRERGAHKGTFGKLLLVCGSANYRGAAVLSAMSALYAGAGLVTLASVEEAISAAAPLLPEAVFMRLDSLPDGRIADGNAKKILDAAGSASALLVGCGLGKGRETQRLVGQLVAQARRRLVIDADGLNALQSQPEILKTAACPAIITPHVGEFSRLTGKPADEIKKNAPKLAAEFAREYGCVVALKDASTVVASPDGKLYYHTGGNPGMSRGGSGDILAGLAASFAAQGIAAEEAAAAAVALHGYAGQRCAKRLSQYGMQPHELLEDFRGILREYQR